MALVACTECNNQISTEAACPSCGAPTKSGADAKSQKSIILGASAIGCGAAAIFLPYFASVFFTPVAIILGLFSLVRTQRLAGVFSLLLGAVGAMGIVETSNRMGAAQREMSTAMDKAQRDMAAIQVESDRQMEEAKKQEATTQ